MCLICDELAKSKMTAKEAKAQLREMRVEAPASEHPPVSRPPPRRSRSRRG